MKKIVKFNSDNLMSFRIRRSKGFYLVEYRLSSLKWYRSNVCTNIDDAKRWFFIRFNDYYCGQYLFICRYLYMSHQCEETFTNF